ncbi:outer membrane beta-barrel protein [Rhodohalobacter sp. 8-1]|uniref:outer membrane beta-barrel protein n=1 Tax=Rhodohalobacter sp. 8-1 TaxID=3131972 RepID=UPI0030EB7113
MKKKTLLTFLSALLLLPLTLTDTANAQWSIGASYEVRDEDPTNGFGVRIERGILSAVPIVDLGLRGHFSYFNESNDLTSEGVTFDQTIQSYDFGLAATGGVSVGLVKPYVGLGIGWDNSSLEYSADAGDIGADIRDEFEADDFYWNGFIGAEVTIIPILNPFIEYRFTQITGRDDIDLDNVSRLALGVSLRF